MAMEKVGPRLVTVPQLYELVKTESQGRAVIGKNKLYALVQDGVIPHIVLGGRVLVREDVLHRLLQKAEEQI